MTEPKNFPIVVQIGEAIYHVVFFTKLTNDDAGYCDTDAKILAISRNQDETEYLPTFIHEVLHAIEFELKCPLGHPKIRKLEYALADVFAQLRADS